MKSISLLCVYLFALANVINAETSFSKGKVSGRIYANLNSNVIGGFNNSSQAFEISRAYFGYSNTFGDNFSAFVLLDIGSVDNDSEYALIRRYTYFKNAGIMYKNNGWELQFGLIGVYQFKLQESFWGKRYMFKSFQDEFRWNSSADLGFFAKRALTELIEVDIMISNGEGYKDFQNDDFLKYSAGVVAKPGNFEFRLGADVVPSLDKYNSGFTLFSGYRGNSFRIGGDANLEINNRNNDGYHRYGFSVYGDIYITEKLSVFGRFDMLQSNILEDNDRPWNLRNDGSMVIGGFEYKWNNYFTASLNYRDWQPYAKNAIYTSAIYLNLEINF